MISGAGHDYRIDIWQLGVVLYELVIGKPPFHSTQHRQLIHNIQSLTYSYPEFLPVSQEFQELVSLMLQIKPEDRIPLENVLSHPWIARRIQKPFSTILPTIKSKNMLSRRATESDSANARAKMGDDFRGDAYAAATRENTEFDCDERFQFFDVMSPSGSRKGHKPRHHPLSQSLCLDGDFSDKLKTMASLREEHPVSVPVPTMVGQSPKLVSRKIAPSTIFHISGHQEYYCKQNIYLNVKLSMIGSKTQINGFWFSN